MKMILERLEKKYPWGLIGGILGLIGLLVGVYFSMYYEKKAAVIYEIINEANILDVRQPLSDLNISFRGEDIQKKNLNLRIFTINIKNDGLTDILQNQYDVKEPWGLKVNNGKVIEIRLTNSNSEYLKKSINPHIVGESQVLFDKSIFEKGKYVTFELLLLHSKTDLPHIQPLGKIAGIETIDVTDNSTEKNEPSFFESLIHGNILIHIIRFIAYFIILIIVLANIVLLAETLSKLKLRFTKGKRIEEIISIPGLIDSNKKSIKYLVDTFINEGIEPIKDIERLLSNKRRVMEMYSNKYSIDEVDEIRHRRLFSLVQIETLIEKEAIFISIDDVIIDPEFERAIKILTGRSMFKLNESIRETKSLS